MLKVADAQKKIIQLPLVDLSAQYVSIKSEIDSAISHVIQESAFIGGKYVTQFEEQFSEYIGSKHCISCANGTDTLEISLRALGLNPGDEVIVPAHTWISTAEAVSIIGAKPVFVDTLPGLYTMDPAQIEPKITKKTKAIIPVHLYGLPAEMDEIMAIAKKHSLSVLEDCAQAHGAIYKGKKVGTFGDLASFSFYPGKNLGAYGDAGCVVTDNDDMAATVKMIANHGQKQKHDHQILGRNSRLDGLQAAILSVKLKYLDKWNSMRREKASIYSRLLVNKGYLLPSFPEYSNHVFHLYVIQCENRKSTIDKLNNAGIQNAVHYPNILPATTIYNQENYSKLYPVSSTYINKILSLPMYPEIKRKEIKRILNTL